MNREQASGDGAVLPLILLNGNGNVSSLSRMNEKSYRKSIEQGHLWHVDPDTGRVLPYREKTYFTDLSRGDGWYAARLPGGTGNSANRAIPAETASSENRTNPADVPPDPDTGTHAAPADASILGELALLLKARKAELPEGSYTSYLFRQGVDKIRKKTGEEAVELILAREAPEIISEAADLLFHMLVLFEALDIDVGQVFDELRNRHK